MLERISFEELDKIKEQEALKGKVTQKILEAIIKASTNKELISTRGICNLLGIDNTDVVLWRCQLLERKQKKIRGYKKGNMYYWKLP